MGERGLTEVGGLFYLRGSRNLLKAFFLIWRNRHAASICSINMQQGHTAWTCSIGHAARACCKELHMGRCVPSSGLDLDHYDISSTPCQRSQSTARYPLLTCEKRPHFASEEKWTSCHNPGKKKVNILTQ
jgi:hypothetical protein